MTDTREFINAARQLYESDEHAWLQQQVDALHSNELAKLDRPKLIEYLTEMLIAQRRELRSRMLVLLMHMLKLREQPSMMTKSWGRAVREQQRQIRLLIEDNAGLGRYLDELYGRAYSLAVADAAEETGLPAPTFPAANPWSLEQALSYVPPL